MPRHRTGARSMNSSFSYSIKEMETIEAAEEIARKDGVSFSQLLLQLLKELIHQRRGYGIPNPIGISYNYNETEDNRTKKKDPCLVDCTNPLGVLEWLLEAGIIGIKQWQPEFAKIQDQEKLQRIVDLIEVIRTTTKDRQSFLKTGRAIVRIGKVEHAALMMKGSRSGF